MNTYTVEVVFTQIMTIDVVADSPEDAHQMAVELVAEEEMDGDWESTIMAIDGVETPDPLD